MQIVNDTAIFADRKAEARSVLIEEIDHEIVLDFLYDLGFDTKDETQGVVILENEDEDGFCFLGLIQDKKNKNYRAQILSTLTTLSGILKVDLSYLVSNLIIGYSDKEIEVKGYIDGIETGKSGTGYVLFEDRKNKRTVRIWLPKEEFAKAARCYRKGGYFIIRMGCGDINCYSLPGIYPDKDVLRTAFILTY